MGFVKRALVSIAALCIGALLIANWRSQGEMQRKLDELVAAVTGRPAEPAAPAPDSRAPGEPNPLPASVVTPAGGTLPRDTGHAAGTAQLIQTPDVLRIEAAVRDPRTGQTERLPVQPILGEYAVRADGTVNLGVWGAVRVAGKTPDQAAEEIHRKLALFTQVNGATSRTDTLVVSVEVKGKPARQYYVVLDAGATGERAHPFPLTGNETVLDAIASIQGLAAVADRRTIQLIRQGPAGSPVQVLPVDWSAILSRGDTRTNYRLQAGDRVHVSGSR